MAHLEILMRII